MQKVLTAAEMREVDRLTTERYGIPSILLMENAAHAVARVITEKLGGSVKGKSILILCGKGNNGGDGFAVARVLWNAGAAITVCFIFPDDEISGDAKQNLSILRCLHRTQPSDSEPVICLAEVGTHRSFFDRMDPFFGPDVVIDALFGTGLIRPLGEDLSILAKLYNSNFAYVDRPLFLSIDIPSGLSSDGAETIGEHFRADITVGFTAPKIGNVLPPASRSNGELIITNIGSPKTLVDEQSSELFIAECKDVAEWVSKSNFTIDSYKNKRGHILLIAGSEGYSGAAALAGNAAMRSGVGLTTLACPASAKELIASRLLPDVILSSIESNELPGHLARADAVAVGCGLDTTDPDVMKLVRDVVANRAMPVILDASALSVLSPMSANGLHAGEGGPNIILTPHEGEFLRLLGTEDTVALKDRVAAVREFSQKHNVILVLKGERVLIGEPGGKVVVNPTGNSGLGKAGNGDTLAGILAGFVAQAAKMDIDLFETVVAAVYVAGMAGDLAEKKYGKRVMTASDVRECLVDVFAEFEKQ